LDKKTVEREGEDDGYRPWDIRANYDDEEASYTEIKRGEGWCSPLRLTGRFGLQLLDCRFSLIGGQFLLKALLGLSESSIAV
jgi:hypothetical protein